MIKNEALDKLGPNGAGHGHGHVDSLGVHRVHLDEQATVQNPLGLARLVTVGLR